MDIDFNVNTFYYYIHSSRHMHVVRTQSRRIMNLIYVDEVSLNEGKIDRIESSSQIRHIDCIESRMLSLFIECALVMVAIVGGAIGTAKLIMEIGWWSPAWATVVIIVASMTAFDRTPWMLERLERRNRWLEIRNHYLEIHNLEQQFTSKDG